MRILERFRLFFFSYRGHSTSWHIRAREEVKGQMELSIETNISSEVSVGAFQIWLLLVTVAELFQKERERERERESAVRNNV